MFNALEFAGYIVCTALAAYSAGWYMYSPDSPRHAIQADE